MPTSARSIQTRARGASQGPLAARPAATPARAPRPTASAASCAVGPSASRDPGHRAGPGAAQRVAQVERRQTAKEARVLGGQRLVEVQRRADAREVGLARRVAEDEARRVAGQQAEREEDERRQGEDDERPLRSRAPRGRAGRARG